MLKKTVAIAVLAASSAAWGSAPTLNLFPSRVVDNIQQTTQVAGQMEGEVQALIAQLDQQYELFEKANCEEAQADKACAQLRQEVAQSYQEMLAIMARDLPKMKEVVGETRVAMAKKIHRELGQRRSAKDLQALLQGQDATALEKITRRRMATGNRMRMSDKFRQYAQLVSTTQSSSSLTLLAADFYLDLAETESLISYTEQEITRAQIIGQIDLAMGGFTPEMLNNIGNVKRILFGAEGDTAPLPAPLPDAEQIADDAWVL